MKKAMLQDIIFGKHAAPISPAISEAIERGTINLEGEEDLDKFIKQLQNVQKEENEQGDKLGRTVSLNLLNINNGKNTIEFRVPNGTINPNTWIDNVRLYGRIVQMAEKLAQIERKDESEKTEEDKYLEGLMQFLKSNMPENEKMEILLELLFTEDERKIYRDRYYTNSKKLESNNTNDNDNLKFAEKVDFRKHTIQEFEETARENNGGYKYCEVENSKEKGEKGE